MPAGHLASQPSSYLSKIDVEDFYQVIKGFLGQGLAYAEWPAEVKKRGYEWHPELENVIIKKEWEFFKTEIQALRKEPAIPQSSRSKSNSLASILKRLKGEPWVKGQLDEREERLRTRRLLGKDAKVRCLQKYVHDWDLELTISASQLQAQGATARPAFEETINQPIAANDPNLEFASLHDINNLWYPTEVPEVDVGPARNNVDVDTVPTCPVSGYPLQTPASKTPISTQFDPPPAVPGDLDPLATPQAATMIPDAEASGGYLKSESSKTKFNSSLGFRQDEPVGSFDHFLINEDDVPASADYIQGSDPFTSELNVIEWLKTGQVSENLEPAETEIARLDPALDGTFLNLDSLDETNFLAFEDTDILEPGPYTEGICTGLPQKDSLDQGSLKNTSQPISPLRSGSGSRRKRRRQDRSKSSFDLLGYGNDGIASKNVISDNDTTMFGYENHPQHSNEQVSQLSWAQIAPPSRPLLTPQSLEMTSKSNIMNIRTQVELELELQHTRQELNSVRKQHQKDLESFARKQQAAEAEIFGLHKQMREIQLLTEYYEEQVRDLNSKNIVLEEANSRNRSALSLLTETRERELSTKPTQNFSPSKNPRPLSLTLRPATANKASSPPRKPNASILQDKSTREVPISTSSSNKSSSADSGQISSGQFVPASSSPKTHDQSNTSRSTESITTSNLATSSRRDTNPLQQLMHKFSSPFLRRQSRDYYNSRTTSAVLVLPPLEASVPLNRQMASILIDGDKRLTNDSGYDSLQFETGSRVSVADIE